MNRPESAETLALQAMAWLLTDADRTGAFLDATGASPSDLAANAAQPLFLGSVLDFLLTDDALVIGFCDAHALPYAAPLAARSQLPGFSQIHWT